LVAPRTRVEVGTEGVLTRMRHADRSLAGVRLVAFAQVHEGSLQADPGCAVTPLAPQLLRPGLRLPVMTATLDVAHVARLPGDAPVVTSEGKSFPVETHYLARPVEGRIEGAVAAGVRRALAEAGGDVLAFLPGAAEIRRTEARLLEGGLPDGVFVAPL